MSRREGKSESGDVFHFFNRDSAMGIGGFEVGAFPVLFHAVDLSPVEFVIPQGVGFEANGFWKALATGLGSSGDQLGDFFFGSFFDFVRGFWPDDVSEGEASFVERGFHHVGGLLLLIDLAGVGHGGEVGEIGGVVGAVVEMPEGSLEGKCFGFLSAAHFEELLGLGKSRTRIGDTPLVGVMDGELPASGSAHREAADGDTIVIDAVVLLGMGEGFEAIDLACEFIGIGEAGVGMEDDGVGRGVLSRLGTTAFHEEDFVDLVVTAVEPEIEAVGFFTGEIVAHGDNESVGLHRAIDIGTEAPDDETSLFVPRCLAILQ